MHPRHAALPFLLLLPLAAQVAPSFAQGTLAEVRERAKTGKQVLVIDFSHDGIEPCRRLLQTTWADAQLWQWLAGHALVARVDPEQHADAAKEFALGAYPTLVVLGKDGAELGRQVGYLDAPAMRARLAELAQTYPTDHRERTKLADGLRRKGQNAEALEHYLWLWDHGEEHNKGFGGVRVSFFLRNLAGFAKTYEPAKAALEERRDALEQRILAGEVRYELVTDLVQLDKAMGRADRLLTVLEKVPAAKWQDENIAKSVLVEAVLEPLVQQRRYDDVRRLMPDPMESLDRAVKGPFVGAIPAPMRKQMVTSAIKQHAGYLEAYFSGRDDKTTAPLVERMLELDASATTWLIVLKAAERAGNDIARHDYAVRALQELPEQDHDRVRKFLQPK
jgi:thiol-disulfide isomerase/thioredoxin